MMINRDSLRYGGYIAIASGILTLTGVFSSFQQTQVITDLLQLSSVLLLLMIFASGYFAARAGAGQAGIPGTVVNGGLAGLVVSLVLGGLVLLNASVDMRFVFPNLGDLTRTTLLLGQEDTATGLLLLLLFGGLVGGLAGLSFVLPDQLRIQLFVSLLMVCVFGLLSNQLRSIITLPDAVVLLVVFLVAYMMGQRLDHTLRLRLGVGLALGLIAGIVLSIAGAGQFVTESGLAGTGSTPRILRGDPFILILTLVIVSGVGVLAAHTSRGAHNGLFYFFTGLLILGMLNARGSMDALSAVVVFLICFVTLRSLGNLGQAADQRAGGAPLASRKANGRLIGVFALIVLLVAPVFMGQYITSVFDLVGLYIIMGIGLNVMVGYAGLLDLGFVASFAIGAYAMGLMTTPSLLTCGGVPPSQLTADTVGSLCTGIMSFWQAWPLAALTAGLTGAMLGVPVLRLRGDYLAIVTLGFGEIINRLLLSSDFKDLLGGAQGISPIPQPVIDVTLPLLGRINIAFGNANNIYYLILFSTLIVGGVVYRLASTRLGRAWRAIRADEDVAEAMGIHLVRNKLLAFGISSTLAGVGGAIFGAWLQGIFPNSFTLLISINVLSLIIIGGLGSIAGVVVGALMLIGLPEVLRELQDYRLLVFGILLVVTMLVRPEGLIPPPVRRLTEGYEPDEGDSTLEKNYG